MKSYLGSAFFGVVVWFFCILVSSAGQEESTRSSVTGLEFDKRMNGEQVLKAIEPLRKMIQQSSAAFFRDGDLIGYGIVMDGGCVLTKASLMDNREGISIRIGEAMFQPESWSATDEEHDLALVRIKEGDSQVKGGVFLETIPEPGTVVISNGSTTRTKRRARIGIISTIPHSAPWPSERIPYLGVSFQEEDSCFVEHVEEGSPAEQSGLKSGDVILSIEGCSISNLADVGKQIELMSPGEPSDWKISRKGKMMDVRLMPGSRRQYLGEKEEAKSELTDARTEEGTSKRKHGFPRVIQHDTSLLPSFMGGPLLDLKGRIIGMNIARVNRAETYALPAADVLSVYRRLCSW